MKKKLLSVLLVLYMIVGALSASAAAANPTGVTATPINPIVYINGDKFSFEAYAINGGDYIKVRDLAMAFNSTNKKFDIGSDSSNKMLEITTNKEYVPVGGELTLGDGKKKTATPQKSTVHWVEAQSGGGKGQSGFNIVLNTYTINGNSFVNLRDLMQWIDVGVGYDSKTSSIVINTHQGYVLPKYSGNPLKSGEAIDNKYRNDYGTQPGSIQNEGIMVYKDGWYYHYGFKVKEGGMGVAYKTDYGDYIAYNWQVYGNKIFFEGDDSNGITNQKVFSMNLDGSGLKRIINQSLTEGRTITVYKGMLYANACVINNGQNTSIVRYNLDGTGRKVLYKGDLSILPRDIGYGYRAYYIFNDRIYFMTKDMKTYLAPSKEVYSMKLDGSDKRKVATVRNTPQHIVNVYDGYIYYQTAKQGLHRVKIDGTGDMCVLPVGADQYAIYGDKIVYSIGNKMLGVVNCDGTSRYQFPNAKQDPDESTENYWSNLTILNNKYTFAQNTIINNDSAVPGRIRLIGDSSDPDDVNIMGKRGWFPTKKPLVNTLTDIIPISGKKVSGTTLEEGIYFIKSAKDPKYALDIMDASTVNDAKLIINGANGSNSQKFRIAKVDNNKYTIKNLNSGRWVTSKEKKGWLLTQFGPVNDSHSQVFSIEKQKDGTYKILDSKGLYLSIANAVMADGTTIVLWTESTGEDQVYVLEKLY